MTSRTIDLNCDLGECEDAAGIANDLALLDVVTSANVACGGHAGDEGSMERTVVAAMQRGVALGAHPGYPDRANFGRVACNMEFRLLADSIASQIAALLRIATKHGGTINHVKPHGALYHAAMHYRDIAELIASSMKRAGLSAILMGQANAPALDVWRGMGLQVAAEAFADRRYESDGSLRARTKPEAMIEDAALAAAQAVRIATQSQVISISGDIVAVAADTLCLHSDTPNALRNAHAVRAALTQSGIACRALNGNSIK